MARGRKPDPEVDGRIKQAAVTMLMTKGTAFTMDDVAAAAGVGRASVFRRYATKRDVLRDALALVLSAHVPDAPDTGSLEGDLLVIATQTLAAWQSPDVTRMSRQVFGEAGADQAIAEVIRTAMREKTTNDWAIFERAIARGELAADADLWLLADMLVGVTVYRGLIEVPQPDPSQLVRALLHGFTK